MPLVPPAPADRVEALARLAEEGQWPVLRRATGRLHAALEIPGFAAQAALDPAGEGARIATEFHVWPRLEAASRDALGVLLLAASDTVPLARAFANETEGRVAVGAEVIFPAEPTSPQMVAALTALSVLGRLCGEDLRVLGAATVAQTYLDLRGQHPRRTTTTNERTDTYDHAIDHAPGGD